VDNPVFLKEIKALPVLRFEAGPGDDDFARPPTLVQVEAPSEAGVAARDAADEAVPVGGHVDQAAGHIRKAAGHVRREDVPPLRLVF